MHSIKIAALTLAMLLNGNLFAAPSAKTPADSATSLPGQGITVKPIQSTLAEETFQTLLVSKALEKLGYRVEKPSEVDYNVGYASLAHGDATFTATNWQPLHDDMYQAAGGDAVFSRHGVYVAGAAQGYLIDKKTAEQYHITRLDDLKDPRLAALFDANGDGKADLTGCNPGWGCESVINHQIQAYGLSNHVNHNQGNYAALMADTIGRYKQGKPILYYTWTPYWVSDVLVPGRDVVWLQVPFSSLPGAQNTTQTALPGGANYGFPVSQMRIVANKAWAQNNPAAAALFASMTLPLADVNAQNLRMHQGESSQHDIERHVDGWIAAHQALFDRWIAHARAAAQ
ncbi:glycine betaine/L-proline ABC transporter substrate-binding protein ProX [Dickeya lacustris]|uniref:Glycine betaine/L-proline ABC transporter substrate-binding protein ProX n=1 Tax=Dickeya lacustris TaxID=2259638 RepID=A0ABY8G578_9GAMM|nr:glycine betaine/L-proline ABC transporter substrate-binding protein ProX [Dickeya lacustris]WFN55088.1 glycine betaine/L-proline ABC transporter substrate-binding protein ProX [Dickeya lacustris]